MSIHNEVHGFTVKARIWAGFALVLLMMVILTIIGIREVNSISRGLSTIGDVNSVKQRFAINFRGSVHDRAIALRDVILVPSEAELAPVLAKIDSLSADYEKSAGPLDKMFNEGKEISDEERRILASIKETEARTLPMIKKVVELRRAGSDDLAKQMMLSEARPAFVEWLGRINKLIDFEENLNRNESAFARGTASGFQTLMLLICLGALIVGAVIATLIVRSIMKALGGEPSKASAIARSIASGDLSVVIDIDSRDQTSVLSAMKEMRDSLVGIVGRVRSSTETISTGSAEIASGNQDLSSRTENQASSLEKTATSMSELTSTVQQNVENAKQANQLAVTASGVAVKGGEVVAQVVVTMGSINDSAKKIVDIIAVIDGIAFQTNILALNAAVEAARAGEQGRGFAVVASEVRSLAQRSAAAAKEIKTLIGDSVEKVDAGSKLVTEAGGTMDEIVGSVKRVTDIMAEIMAASQEQSAGIAEVNQAISQMDQVTQQNAALVEQAAAAAESMQEQASQLSQTVAIFNLGGSQSGQFYEAAQPRPVKTSLPVRKLPAVAPASGSIAHASAAKRIAPAPAAAGKDWEEF
ncbi:methyl-accepting chemotaxis protein [Herbaspirillum sp. RTI4]|uniref:methyl-accepting chemotaxis protein n=1 Tax=Herbaspirillum sp. RTI4 TaxID=3048640 RepID=UPI002AB48CC5|nr:methyl-accepting chemotaxis protein [Herbaspirillum sp. RTI4]MDY7578799.1 methyl-accepting chemotaxis protein [Herbaspirillum sp. RTI4]MEA9982280.1 methyl-accepting chemotaxis protein [Herbaspirillum sp. RTI4]